MTDKVNSETMLAWVFGWIIFCAVAGYFGYHIYSYYSAGQQVLALKDGNN